MSDCNFTFRVDPDVKALFVKAAKANNRSASLLLRDFMIEYTQAAQAREPVAPAASAQKLEPKRRSRAA